MAHADYQCCTCCDEKMEYGSFPSKTGFCPACVAGLAVAGFVCRDVGRFNDICATADLDKLLPVLKQLGYRRCYYIGMSDEALEIRGVKFDDKTRLIAD